jgi:large subunit ribosomal protein L29
MQISEVRELNDTELSKELGDHERALMNLRFRKATMQLTNTNELGNTRKTIARIKTVLRERAITVGMDVAKAEGE